MFYSICTLVTHTMSSSNSSEIQDHTAMVFLGIMDEAMSIVQAKEAMATAASSSTRQPKRARRYVNRNHETAHFRLRCDYFDDDCVYPCHTSTGGIVCGGFFF
jgi:hypothetical protein